ncbi:diaminopropionate ammonia-lyase [Veronia pacifica]|uniref:Diaminopropionate ammonia-lyase n=1 Tax=Veronia pacifica TaxID=1080227 RepID=A0A1C3ESF7_9GAMM|nr:diaminopropionate ammonia-lyase [Veronia pacifica]ODA36159.1 diaminopropionate ammonia-lyase [Veronia pacifica]
MTTDTSIKTTKHLIEGTVSHFANPRAGASNVYTDQHQSILNLTNAEVAIRDIKKWPGYKATPLLSLNALSDQAGFSRIWYKDESQRFALKSFKALGGAFAVARQLQAVLREKIGQQVSIDDLLLGMYSEHLADVTVSCATDGNHGRSVAWGAQMFGCQCVIFIHSDVSEGRRLAMEQFGAEVIRIDGNYDESVRTAAEQAKQYNRIIVSDTSYEGYMDIPKDVALGYTVMLAEIIEQLDGEIPTHVVVQGGVGGLAAAVCGYFWQYWQQERPRFVVVEPENANCLQQSARAGRPVTVTGDLETMMAGLCCGEVSLLAWTILASGADDFMTVSEETVPQTMQLLAKGVGEDPAVEAGESAVAGLAAMVIARKTSDFANQLNLNSDSKILVLGTEGATDPELYHQLVTSQINESS